MQHVPISRARYVQENRKMRFQEAYEGWSEGRLTQAEAALLLGQCERSFRRHIERFEADGLDGLLDKISASPAKLVALAWMDGGSRSLYTKKPVRKPEDLKGQKIRMMGNPLFVDTMNAMGGNGIAMGYGEVFTAIQTGVIDGAENNPPSLFTANHFKAGAKYYTQTNHLIIPEILVMSKVTWDKLSPADQALVKKSAREAQMEQRTLWDAAVADYTAKLKAEGVEFIEMDNKPFYDATVPVRAKYGAAYADLMKRIADVK
mgnify:CR=1 FL=1